MMRNRELAQSIEVHGWRNLTPSEFAKLVAIVYDKKPQMAISLPRLRLYVDHDQNKVTFAASFCVFWSYRHAKRSAVSLASVLQRYSPERFWNHCLLTQPHGTVASGGNCMNPGLIRGSCQSASCKMSICAIVNSICDAAMDKVCSDVVRGQARASTASGHHFVATYHSDTDYDQLEMIDKNYFIDSHP